MEITPDRNPDTPPSVDPAALPTREYEVLQKAFDHFNDELFGGSLPRVLLTFQREAKQLDKSRKSFFYAERFADRTSEQYAHEIALNPDRFGEKTEEEILSILVHEMVHLWQ